MCTFYAILKTMFHYSHNTFFTLPFLSISFQPSEQNVRRKCYLISLSQWVCTCLLAKKESNPTSLKEKKSLQIFKLLHYLSSNNTCTFYSELISSVKNSTIQKLYIKWWMEMETGFSLLLLLLLVKPPANQHKFIFSLCTFGYIK